MNFVGIVGFATQLWNKDFILSTFHILEWISYLRLWRSEYHINEHGDLISTLEYFVACKNLDNNFVPVVIYGVRLMLQIATRGRPPLVPIDDGYEATIDTKASNKKREEEEGEEVDQPVGDEAVATPKLACKIITCKIL